MTRYDEYTVNDYCVEQNLKVKLQEFIKCELRSAHEISGDQDKTVNPCFPPCSKYNHDRGGNI